MSERNENKDLFNISITMGGIYALVVGIIVSILLIVFFISPTSQSKIDRLNAQVIELESQNSLLYNQIKLYEFNAENSESISSIISECEEETSSCQTELASLQQEYKPYKKQLREMQLTITELSEQVSVLKSENAKLKVNGAEKDDKNHSD